MDTIVAGPSNLSTPEPGGGDGTGSAVDSPRPIGTAHTITDLLDSQVVDLLRTPPSEGSDSAGQEWQGVRLNNWGMDFGTRLGPQSQSLPACKEEPELPNAQGSLL
ncbi:hypothetical protein Trydic_g20001 [Trypoxylus dichotomus]